MGHDKKKNLTLIKQKPSLKTLSKVNSDFMHFSVSGDECPKQEKDCFECTILDCPEEDA